MIPKSSGWSILVQFAGYRTTLTFLRKDVSLGCAAQLSTKRIICLFCASKLWRNEQKNLCCRPCFTVHVVFSWQFFNILEALGIGDFPITIGTCLSLSSLLTHSSTVSLFGMFSAITRFSFIRQGSIRKHIE